MVKTKKLIVCGQRGEDFEIDVPVETAKNAKKNEKSYEKCIIVSSELDEIGKALFERFKKAERPKECPVCHSPKVCACFGSTICEGVIPEIWWICENCLNEWGETDKEGMEQDERDEYIKIYNEFKGDYIKAIDEISTLRERIIVAVEQNDKVLRKLGELETYWTTQGYNAGIRDSCNWLIEYHGGMNDELTKAYNKRFKGCKK
jgi:hypothetical protein